MMSLFWFINFTKFFASLKFTASGFSTKTGKSYFAQIFKSFILDTGGVDKMIASGLFSKIAFSIFV